MQHRLDRQLLPAGRALRTVYQDVPGVHPRSVPTDYTGAVLKSVLDIVLDNNIHKLYLELNAGRK